MKQKAFFNHFIGPSFKPTFWEGVSRTLRQMETTKSTLNKYFIRAAEKNSEFTIYSLWLFD